METEMMMDLTRQESGTELLIFLGHWEGTD